MPKTIPTAEKFAQLFESPRAQTLIAELNRDREQELDARRAATIAAIADVQSRAERELPKLRATVDDAQQAVRAAELVLVDARHRSSEAVNTALGASNASSREITEQQAVLQETAPDAAVEFMRWTWDEFDRARRTGETVSAGTTGNRQLFQKVQRRALTNMPSLTSYVEALRAAREEILRLTSKNGLSEALTFLQRGR